MDHEVRVDISP